MSKIRITSSTPVYNSKLIIDGITQKNVRSFSIEWSWQNAYPTLKVLRWKLDESEQPYTIGGGYVASLTEYYPVHELVIENDARL